MDIAFALACNVLFLRTCDTTEAAADNVKNSEKNHSHDELITMKVSSRVSVAIIGGGIVGLATAMELTARFPGISLCVLEKEQQVASHQTGHNSGVIHSGIYYKPGSLKAKLCVEGVERLLEFCQMHGIAYEQCGKLIVATEDKELPKLDELYRRGVGNGLRDLRMLDQPEIREIEPHAAGIRGIHVPVTGIVDYGEVARRYAEVIIQRGSEVRTGCEVTAIVRSQGRTILETTCGEVIASLVVNCSGLQSDRIARMAGDRLHTTIVPFRGEYYDLAPAKASLVRGLIYPVPDPRFPFLGVHFTRRMRGGVEAGPNAVLSWKREGYKKLSFRARDVVEYVTFPGFWIMAAKYGRMGLEEYHRSFSKAAFVQSLQRLLPELTEHDLVPGGSGVRAQALGRDGQLIDDFLFVSSPRILHVCNVPSPAATASLAIARHIVDTLVKQHDVEQPSSMVAVP